MVTFLKSRRNQGDLPLPHNGSIPKKDMVRRKGLKLFACSVVLLALVVHYGSVWARWILTNPCRGQPEFFYLPSKEEEETHEGGVTSKQQESNQTLVILMGNLRGGEKAWKTLYRRVLDINNADLALVIGEGGVSAIPLS